MKRSNKKKNSHIINIALMILMLCVMVIFVFEYSFCATIYQNDIIDNATDKNIGIKQHEAYDRSKIGPVADDENIKPTAKSTIDPNILYTTRKTWEKERKKTPNIIIQKETITPSEATHEYKPTQKFTYIRHRSGISSVIGDYQWEDYEDDDKVMQKKLFIYHSDEEQGLPHYAYSGFYKIGEDTYCFDKNGHLIKGMAKDEYDIVYEFDDETGKLIKQYKEQ